MFEVWRDIPGYEGLYAVSTLGRVMSLPRMERLPNGSVRLRPGRFVKAAIASGGYPSVSICRDSKVKTASVHNLIALTFIGPRPGGSHEVHVCHNDGNPLRCRLSNIRYDTVVGNHADKKKHGTLASGERHGMAKLTEKDVLRIRDRLSTGDIRQTVAEDFGVSIGTIDNINKRRNWTHV